MINHHDNALHLLERFRIEIPAAEDLHTVIVRSLQSENQDAQILAAALFLMQSKLKDGDLDVKYVRDILGAKRVKQPTDDTCNEGFNLIVNGFLAGATEKEIIDALIEWMTTDEDMLEQVDKTRSAKRFYERNKERAAERADQESALIVIRDKLRDEKQ